VNDPGYEDRHGPDTLRVWRGVVVGVNGDDVFVELGPRMQGVISRREFDGDPEPGDVHEYTLHDQEDGLWALSLRHTGHLTSWEAMERGSLVQARVIRPRPGGLELKIGPLHAFLPASQTGLPRGEEQQLVGRNVTCEVIEVDAERQRVVVSRRVVVQRERESARQRAVDALKPGAVVQGRVTRIEPYGAFVRFGRGLEGLIHVSNLSHERVLHPSEVLAVGQSVDARVLYIKQGGKRIALGLKQMSESPWASLERELHPGRIVEGVVSRIAEYGAFVALRPGVEGLVPRSQTGLGPERGLQSLLTPGQPVSVRVLDVDAERERMTLSLLHESGARIDPGEAAGARDFEEHLQGSEPAARGFRLGASLRKALGVEEPPGDASSSGDPG
jgi:small subunit ribosomal protein S1